MKIFANNRQASKYQVETTCLNAWLLQQSVLIHSEIVKELEGTFYFMLCMSMSILENFNRDPDQESFVLTVQFRRPLIELWIGCELTTDCRSYYSVHSTQYSTVHSTAEYSTRRVCHGCQVPRSPITCCHTVPQPSSHCCWMGWAIW